MNTNYNALANAIVDALRAADQESQHRPDMETAENGESIADDPASVQQQQMHEFIHRIQQLSNDAGKELSKSIPIFDIDYLCPYNVRSKLVDDAKKKPGFAAQLELQLKNLRRAQRQANAAVNIAATAIGSEIPDAIRDAIKIAVHQGLYTCERIANELAESIAKAAGAPDHIVHAICHTHVLDCMG
ncbi:hypothetical protein H4R20_002446 [Coemansia guatemalensis]|uniref:Uncharacterized protein n=1 Tax=Coemansia guatemalensis TaxID=2761395 RepID=A0A9W8LTY9_9FUNG|nr:hypothetical protein H4R20_002446 [Coemansia guatemalensis]